mgnify:FL=1
MSNDNYILTDEDLEVLSDCTDNLWTSLADLNSVYEQTKKDHNHIARTETAVNMSKIVTAIMDLYHFDRYVYSVGNIEK